MKKEYFWIGILAVLLVIYFRFFTGSGPQTIYIEAVMRPGRHGRGGEGLLFKLDRELKLTHVKVIPFLDDKFDPLQRPAWDIISDSNSVPTRAFFYGQHIKGMTSALANVKPESLVPGQLYRVEVTAGKIMGQLDFRDRELSQ